MHISRIVTKQNPQIIIKQYYLDEHGIAFRKFKDGSNIFHTIMVPLIFTTIHII